MIKGDNSKIDENEKQVKTDSADVKDPLKDVVLMINKLLQTNIIKVDIKFEGLGVNIFDETGNEVLCVSYEPDTIFAEIDLPYKEVIEFRALGLKIRSKQSLIGLEQVARRLNENIN